MPDFDVVFFDSGGTLYAEDPDAARAAGDPDLRAHYAGAPRRVRRALQALGIEVAEDRLRRTLEAAEPEARAHAGQAYTFVTLTQFALPRCGLDARPEICAYAADAYAGPRYRSWLFPGTWEAVRRLWHAGIDLGVIANTDWPGFSMDRAFAGVGLGGFFRTRVYSGDVGVAKPDRGIFEIAAERAGLHDQRVLFVGNEHATDGRGARGLGWPVALRPGPGNEEFGPDHLFSTWNELLAIVGVD